ncbi:MAG: cation transporter [Pirellulales bacterium]|nr:cation transporter [Pirellulales bacterium]
MGHDHHHPTESSSDQRLFFSLGLNLLLTLFEVVAGILAGSLALLADALHNLSDCGTFVIALIARRVGRLPSDDRRTFGYRRAEIVGALINLTVLAVTSVYLGYEAFKRLLLAQHEVNGRIIIVAAAVALAVNVTTTLLLHALSRTNMNVRAAYLHNLGDSLSSLGVIVAGAIILKWGLTWVDAIASLIVSLFIIWQALPHLREAIHILLEGAPDEISLDALSEEMQAVSGVVEVHHLHLWEIGEHDWVLESPCRRRWQSRRALAKYQTRTETATCRSVSDPPLDARTRIAR